MVKPLERAKIRELVSQACKVRHEQQPPAGPAAAGCVELGADGLAGRCPAMQEVYKAIGRVAPQDVTVLILGESGTGKELVARAIYQHSRRAERPVPGHQLCRHPRDALLESELFGHEKGRLHRRRPQAASASSSSAHGGTLFLDEVGDMTPADAEPRSCASCRSSVRAGRRQRDHPDRRPHHRRHQPRSGGQGGQTAGSARTSTTG